MSEDWRHLPGCNDPQVGRLLEGYLERQLTVEQEIAFEEHYFRCPVCLAELQMRQALPAALKEAGDGAWRRWPWTSIAAGLAALLLAYPAYLGIVELPGVSRHAGDLRELNGRLLDEKTKLESDLKRSEEEARRQRAWTGTAALTILTGPSRSGEPAPVVTVEGRQPYLFVAAAPSLPDSLEGSASVRFEIVPASGPPVWSAGMTAARLREQMRPSRVITLMIPADVVKPGRYTLTLSPEGAAGDLLFRVPFEVAAAR